MHEQNIEVLRDEALRLVNMQLDILRKMLVEPGVIANPQPDQPQTFDRDTTPKYIEVLEGEKTKLDRLELVLAVVGTMKAGKSTTINAIVGTEVLPNRNRPMTALPTLIEHTPGQLEPVLEFKNSTPIEQLMQTLDQAIKRPENRKIVNRLAENQDMQKLLDLIQQKTRFKQTYEDAGSIFWFLKILNDLVRLSQEIGVEFPFSSYDKIHELPVIRVEFIHLREMNQSAGKLTLLDTPGPNESGQPHLRKMLKEQLDKASAVLAVLDFTQLKSEADAQVRDNLKEIADVAAGRLYALVNKFDQMDRHCDSPEQTKSFVANVLMEGKITEDVVFPISSKFAYLANCARRELVVRGKLPDHHEQPWVADFGEAAFGSFWEESIADLDDVKKYAERLWNRSAFHAPLKNVIQSAHTRAAALAVESASAKLVEMSNKLAYFLNMRENALSIDSQELKHLIGVLQKDVNRIDATEAAAKKAADEILDTLENGTKKVFRTVKDNVFSAVDKYFKEGKQEEEAEHHKKPALTDGRTNRKGSWHQKKISSNDRNQRDFDPSSPIIKLSDKKAAKAILEKIQKSLEDIFRDNESIMKKAMNSALVDFQSKFSKTIILDAKKIIVDVAARMKKSGFSDGLNGLTIPDASLLSLKTSGAEILINLIEKKSEKACGSRRKNSVWGKVCSWFDTYDWGWESYDYDEDVFEINVDKIRKSVASDVERIFAGLEQDVTNQIRQPLQSGIRSFFDDFRRTVEQIRGDLMQSICDKETSQAEQDALVKRLSTLKKKVPPIHSDSSELHKDMKHQLDVCIEGTT